MGWSLKDIEASPVAHLNKHLFEKEPGKKVVKEKYTKEKYWINFRLDQFAKENNLELKKEHSFHPDRKWRFDWAFPELKMAYEYEGIFSAKSRHTTAKGFTGDADKYNAAQELGWRVIRYTAMNYTDLTLQLINLKNEL